MTPPQWGETSYSKSCAQTNVYLRIAVISSWCLRGTTCQFYFLSLIRSFDINAVDNSEKEMRILKFGIYRVT